MNPKLKNYWSGKSILITGASSGLGYALAEALARYNVQLGLLSRREQPMWELAEKHRDSGSKFWIKSCDVRERSAVESAVREFHEYAGKIDVAWINSGVAGNTHYRKWNYDFVEALIDTNIKGAIYTTKACLDYMVANGNGTIVGISSASSMQGLPARGVYSMTKIALTYYLQSVAAELPQIQFTIINPGFVDTPINRGNPNRFWLLYPDKAAQLMIKAVAKKKAVYTYPFRMMLLYKFVWHLPDFCRNWLARKLAAFSDPGSEG